MGSRRRLLLLVVVLVLVGLAFVYGAVGAGGPGGMWLPWVMAGVSWPLATATAPASATPTGTPTRAPAGDVRIGTISGDGEYVVVRNVGTGGQVMTGWWLRSADGQSCQPLASQTFTWPSGYVLGAVGSRCG